jgi:hypothetical protein
MKPASRMGLATVMLLLAIAVWFASGDRAYDTAPGLAAPAAAAGLPLAIAALPAGSASGSPVGPQAHAVLRAAAEIHPHLHLIEAAKRSLRPVYV